jgi:phosphopantothenoylcysteine decarboxylase / phosphopantothenate---cysteine ligase
VPAGSSVVLGVGGGIAAYKVVELLRLLTEAGHCVRVVPTRRALRFVGAATWSALSGAPVDSGVWDRADEVPHVRVGRDANLLVVAPATADLLAKAAAGLADDLLTNTLLTARCPTVFVPAMHTEMWTHPATQDNVTTLRRRGALVLEPATGRLTGADSGVGRLPEPEAIYAVLEQLLLREGNALDLVGRRVVVSAGGTREYLDPVRYLGNRSSGRQGYAVAEAALSRGAEVVVVAANVALRDPAGAKVVPVETTEQLRAAVAAEIVGADALVMAAAPADFRPAATADTKIKRAFDGSAPSLALVQNPDILAEVGRSRPAGLVVVGFAAETGDQDATGLEHARAKLARKRCDLLVVNDVSGGRVFGGPDNEAVILGSDGSATSVPPGPKAALAHVILDLIGEHLAAG